jgi:hypothetical protein
MSNTTTLEDIWQLFRETDRLLKEQGRETDRKLHELAEAHRETDLALKETERVLKEQGQETDRQLRETYGMVRELKQQIGGLGNKFGSFTEGLALPSIEKILRERFKAEIITPRVRIRRNGVSAEFDVVAWTNGTSNTAVVVEIKSHLREDGIEQLLKNLAQFAHFFPEHATKKLYGMVAAVDIPDALLQQALAQGLYVARIEDDNFELLTPTDFVARDFAATP